MREMVCTKKKKERKKGCGEKKSVFSGKRVRSKKKKKAVWLI